MRRRFDFVNVIEAAYRVEGGNEAWLQGIVDAAGPAWGSARAVAAFIAEFDEQRATFRAFAADLRGYPEVVVREALALDDAHIWRRLRSFPVALLSDHFARPVDERPRLRSVDARDGFGLIAADPGPRFAVLGFALPRKTRLAAGRRELWTRLSAHMAAGLRLRSLVARDTAEAVLAPDGSVLHAEIAAKPAPMREELRRAALAIDRARGALRRSDADEAVEIWQGLVAGRWSLLERFESDGRRFLIARRNDPAARPARVLSTRERQVAGYAALGHSNKLIAYELGISVSSVNTHLAHAQAKLRVRSRLELINALGWLDAEHLARQASSD
ncbi:LuxR C-terminal-related transcriptional regulator [Sorangium sp. So ce327]|uniref:helix-turn-helix transcriptional regulator n=1 Tax=Sorangium sp. So ce327 TaxID=3133301 RepID=UPI003F60F9E9